MTVEWAENTVEEARRCFIEQWWRRSKDVKNSKHHTHTHTHTHTHIYIYIYIYIYILKRRKQDNMSESVLLLKSKWMPSKKESNLILNSSPHHSPPWHYHFLSCTMAARVHFFFFCVCVFLFVLFCFVFCYLCKWRGVTCSTGGPIVFMFYEANRVCGKKTRKRKFPGGNQGKFNVFYRDCHSFIYF